MTLHPLLLTVREAISRDSLLAASGRPVVAALSGGADSVALLSVLAELGYNCVAAHCNFHLRGEESDRDMRLCQDLCRNLGIDLCVRDFDVSERRKATGESVEMACRSLRYEWFHSLLDRRHAQAVAVAHHRQDNEETFLLNLLRGSSITGMTGMKPRNGLVVRPMLDATRDMIENYLADRGLAFVVDSSNLTNAYLRNRLRHIVLPALREACPDADRGILATMEYLNQNREFYEQQMQRLAARYRSGDEIDLKGLISNEPHARLILFEMLRPMGFNITHVENILASAGESGRVFVARDCRLELSRGVLRVVRPLSPVKSDDEVEVSLLRDVLTPVHISITEHDISEFKPRRDPKVAYLDAEILGGNHTFAIRCWRRGDRLQPYGMESTRLVSDIMSDAHLTADEKRKVRILTCDGKLLWVVGLRTSAHYAITPRTRKYLRLELK